MDILARLFTNRRGAIVLIPVIVLIGDLIGIPISDAMLNDGYDKAMVGIMSLLSAWSLFQPKE